VIKIAIAYQCWVNSHIALLAGVAAASAVAAFQDSEEYCGRLKLAKEQAPFLIALIYVSEPHIRCG